MLRNILAFVLAVILITGIFSIVFAQQNTYTWPNCTWYTAEKRPDLLVFKDHAKNWDDRARENKIPVKDSPSIGAIVVFEPGVQYADSVYGHVAYVEDVYDSNTYRVSELNWGSSWIERTTVHYRTAYTGSGVSFVLTKESQSRETIETFFYDTYEESAFSQVILLSGKSYIVTIEGTFSLWSPSMWGQWTGNETDNTCEGTPEKQPLYPSPNKDNGPTSHDAEYFFAYPKYSWYGEYTCKTGVNTLGRSYTILLSLDGGRSFTHIEPINSQFAQSHSYQYRITGKGYTLGIKLPDVLYTDNNGMLKVVIEME